MDYHYYLYKKYKSKYRQLAGTKPRRGRRGRRGGVKQQAAQQQVALTFNEMGGQSHNINIPKDEYNIRQIRERLVTSFPDDRILVNCQLFSPELGEDALPNDYPLDYSEGVETAPRIFYYLPAMSQSEILINFYNKTGGERWRYEGESVCERWIHFVETSKPPSGGLGKLEGITSNAYNDVTSIELYRTQLTGPIPPELGQLGTLTRLSLSKNQLTDPIPPELGQLAALKALSLTYNQLTGPIPVELGQLATLTILSLQGNQLTGQIPAELGQLRALIHLSLGYNQLSGQIPAELGQLGALTQLHLPDNQLTGPIPAELGQLGALTQLGLSNNLLTGTIPPELGQLSELRYLNLTNNQLTGDIPDELGPLIKGFGVVVLL